jgi:lipopolysaccharide/colanic/teichoic acid biosynthesis glycosyltransferase
MEPGQCAVFDLRSLANSIAWNRAPLSRIRVAATTQPYVERVIENGRRELVRITREYGSADSGSCRVLLTRRASLAQIWANSEKRRGAWTELRRFIDWTRTDHYRIEGYLSRCKTPESTQELIELLVQEWPEPGLAIDGLTEIRPGIWGLEGTQLHGLDHIVAPAWIGHCSDDSLSGILVGPAALGDEDSGRPEDTKSPRILDIAEIQRASNRDGIESVEDVSVFQLSKRVIDFILSLVVLLLLTPVLIGIAVTILIQDGRPVFFPHIRQTRGGRDFKCWKFRTMLRGAESLVPNLSHENVADGPQVYIRNDPRITPIGRFLRRFHLDELPQFWNVLVGDMSLVGPRPSPDRENQFCPAWREARLSVRPGITGLWQVERTRAPGRDFQEWIKYDIEYVNRASFMLDLRICIKTVVRIIRGQD